MEKIRTNYDVIQSHLTDLENSSESNMDSFMFDLFKSILKLDPTQRPSLKSILNHPFFWEASKCMDFILSICKKLEILNPNFRKKLIKRISVHNDINSQTPRLILLKEKLNENVMVINNDWKLHLDDVLMTDFQKGYVGTSVTELLRAIRNKVSFILIFLLINIYNSQNSSGLIKKN